jgi:hypothetical protein
MKSVNSRRALHVTPAGSGSVAVGSCAIVAATQAATHHPTGKPTIDRQAPLIEFFMVRAEHHLKDQLAGCMIAPRKHGAPHMLRLSAAIALSSIASCSRFWPRT